MHLNSMLFYSHLLFSSLTYCQLFHTILLLLCLVKLQSPLLFLRLLYCVKMLYCFVEHVPIIIKYHSVGIISFCKITPATTEVVLHDDMYPWRRRPLQHRNRIHILCLVHHRASWTDRQIDAWKFWIANKRLLSSSWWCPAKMMPMPMMMMCQSWQEHPIFVTLVLNVTAIAGQTDGVNKYIMVYEEDTLQS